MMYDEAMQKMITFFLRSRSANVLVNIFLAILWGLFVSMHIRSFNASQNYALLFFAFSETLLVLFFLIRRDPQTISVDPFDWLVAGGGTLAPLFLRPDGYVLWQHGDILVLFAVALQILAVLSLNRSFAIVAAKRKVVTSGLYRFVRHPMYTSYIFLYGGYLLFNGSPTNILLVFMAFVFLFLRLAQEEKHLAQDSEYRSYMIRTKWRLIPFVY